MKRKVRVIGSILVVGIVGVLLSACREENSLSKPYDLAIFSESMVTTFKEKDNQLIKVESQQKKGKEATFDSASSISLRDNNFVKIANDKQTNAYVAKIDNNLLVETVEVEQGIDLLASDEEFLYMVNSTENGLAFFKYDSELEVIEKAFVKVSDAAAPQGMVILDEYLYILLSSRDLERSKNTNRVLKLTKAFEMIEEKTLDAPDSAYLNMSGFGNKLYISEGINLKRELGQSVEPQHILILDIETDETEYIPLSYPYPMEIYVDEVNQNLIIRHYELYVKSYTWTVYSLNEQQERFVHFPEYEQLEQERYVSPPFFAQKNGLYYFMFFDQMTKFNPKNEELIKMDLSGYKLDEPHTLIVK